MITIRDFMEVTNYRITEGSDYTWHCFGDNAYQLSSWDGKYDDGVSVSIVFDTRKQTVYQMEAHDYAHNRSYRWTHPDYRDTYRKEALTWFDGDLSKDLAYDDVKFIELETDEDMLGKATAIVNKEEYDERVSVPIELPDDELFLLMKLAHEKDITLNQLVEQAIQAAIEKFEKDPEAMKHLAQKYKK